MTANKVFEANLSCNEQADAYKAFGLKPDEYLKNDDYWVTQAASLKATLDGLGIKYANVGNEQIVAAAPAFFAGRGEKESAGIISTMYGVMRDVSGVGA